MYNIIIAIVGALMNRVRGGYLTTPSWKMNWTNEGVESPTKSIGKIGNDVIFSLFFTLPLFSGINLDSILSFTILFFAMWTGRSFGWGTYIGGMIEKKVAGEEEIIWIDKLVLNKTDHPVFRNTAALSLRGLMWSVSLVIGFIAIAPFSYIPLTVLFILPVGLFMGPVYLLAMKISENGKGRGFGWSLGEIFWGFVLWGTCAISILH
mgnify:FL=1|tara:strand:- start:1827 stop:2447 length:621 start_codon:yes stop_codon:yes gene_type:complete